MPQFNRRELDERSRQYGFNRDTFEKVLEEALKPDMKVFTAGDAKRGGRRIPDAIHEAFQVALLL